MAGLPLALLGAGSPGALEQLEEPDQLEQHPLSEVQLEQHPLSEVQLEQLEQHPLSEVQLKQQVVEY